MVYFGIFKKSYLKLKIVNVSERLTVSENLVKSVTSGVTKEKLSAELSAFVIHDDPLLVFRQILQFPSRQSNKIPRWLSSYALTPGFAN